MALFQMAKENQEVKANADAKAAKKGTAVHEGEDSDIEMGGM